MVKVAINGFGRIGRQAFKAMLEKGIEVVAINDLTDNATLAHLLQFDSVYGKFSKEVKSDSGHLIVDGKKIAAFSEKDPAKLPWKALGVDIVLESTGVFRTEEQCKPHLLAGAKKVVISAPPKDETGKQFILNVNTDSYNPKTEHVLSMASCTTNCLAPMVKVLHEGIGIEKGFLTTVHAYTADQSLVDGPHKDLRRARAAAINLVPTSTGAAKAITSIFTDLKGKLDGIAVRVPVPTGSITDFTCVMKRETSAEEVNALFKKAASGALSRNLEYSEGELVSTDIVGNAHGCIFDSKLTKANGRLVKAFGWYDNEWGYSSLLADFMLFLAKKGFA
ncbi:MAG: type I glyceraldehyde-3-phosphate dehydrogenase [archaeon]